jgi:hypothetical protein
LPEERSLQRKERSETREDPIAKREEERWNTEEGKAKREE